MEQLTEMKCVACRAGEPTVTQSQITQYMPQVPGWNVIDEGGVKRLERSFQFPNFVQALAFTNLVGQLAESEQHHPQIVTEWGKVSVKWWTHKIGGLHRNDFIMAAKTNEIYNRVGPTAGATRM